MFRAETYAACMHGPEVRHRVYLHVGVPESGTTYLQAALTKNRKALRDAGFLYPGGDDEPMFRAALDVRGNQKAWGRKRSEVEGAWDRLCRKARTHEGTTVIGHELLSAASARQVTAARSMLAGLDVHVVVTASDLGRQVIAGWQEEVKQGQTTSFEEFRRRIVSGARENGTAQRFWASQDLPDVLTRWTSRLPAENVHVVCRPAPTADPGELWRRFAGVVGFDPDAFDPTETRSASSSLGVAEIDLLRQVNTALGGRLVPPRYGRVVRHYLAKQLLAGHGSVHPQLPPQMYEDLVTVGERWVKEIDRAGYAVHGDLAELIPTPPLKAGPHPDEVDSLIEVTTAAAAIAELLVEIDRLEAEVADLESDKKSSKKKHKLLKRRLASA